ncbi:MAG: amino acid adenylation domain-containing protein, partial [Gemmatimonadetes bacterium]|nr:amino acid adenylation domain-containing protein [Gemmatimonadota bacterium]
DYALWQRAYLSGERLEGQLAYWRARLADAPPLLEIPTDHPRAVGPRPRAGSHRFALSTRATRGLQALARREGATLFMTLLAGWQALLGRYAGQDDLVVGTPVAGRDRRETEDLVGLFVNMLALRVDLSADPSFLQLLSRVRKAALEAYAHQDLPFERLVEELVVGRSLAHAPLFQVTFALDRSGGRDLLELGELRPEPFATGAAVTRFDLGLTMREEDGSLSGVLLYRAALFEPETGERMLRHLEVLLEAVAADPRLRLSDVPLLDDAERAQVLHAWNATAVQHPEGCCVHTLFAEQAACTPDALAVVFEDRTLSYAELEREANRLARHLRRLGVAPEVLVGVCLERGLDLLVAVLGVLKAGGAYVPLDPASPSERQRTLLADAHAPVLLTQAHLAARLEGYRGAVVRLDADREIIAREPDEAPRVEVAPRNLAYVIYTSGSTGTPKGVLVEHRSVLNLFAALREAIYAGRGAGAPPRVSMNGPLSFDTSVKQWVQLLGGATLYPVPEAVRVDPGAMTDYLRRHRVEVLDCTPSQLRMLLGEGLLEKGGTGVTDVLAAGEALDEGVWEVLAATEGRPGWNLYGPTECTVDVALSRVWGTRPVIGRPVANARAYVLDPAGEPAPVGIPGELYVGGVGVARGYLGRAAQTSESFVPDPFSGEAGARLYRTGDRVRWLADGTLEYLGRLDFQVKIRGFRIEPGEVEAVLREHALVRQVMVVAREDARGEKRLVAYVVPEAGTEVTRAELRTHLRERVPEHMVPSAFVLLEALPLNASGKVDRRALPPPEHEEVGASVAPRTMVEEVLAGIWAEVLGIERVGVEESFFELGGHSLLAMRVVSRAREAFRVELPLRALFEAPTVAALAERIEGLRRAGAEAAPPIERARREGPLPLSFAQQRLWLV